METVALGVDHVYSGLSVRGWGVRVGTGRYRTDDVPCCNQTKPHFFNPLEVTPYRRNIKRTLTVYILQRHMRVFVEAL